MLGSSASVAFFQMRVCICARFTFSVNASVFGGNAQNLGAADGDFPTLVAHTRCRVFDIVFVFPCTS